MSEASQAKAGATPLLVVMSGPSGVGKDAVLEEMRRSHPELHFTITATTRAQRPGEVDGRNYLFMPEADFKEQLAAGELLEHAEVYGRWYGVPRGPLRRALAEGKDVVLKVDVQGARTIREAAPDALLIFLVAPSMEEQERRLRERKTESPEDLERRISTAREELDAAEEFDHIVVNETGAVDKTVARVLEIMAEERRRAPPRLVAL